jgi:hypothetical protein
VTAQKDSIDLEEQIKLKSQRSDNELLAEIVTAHFSSRQLMGGQAPASNESAFKRFVRPDLAEKICAKKHLFMAHHVDAVAVGISLLPYHPAHIAAAIAVYVCRVGLEKLCSDAVINNG